MIGYGLQIKGVLINNCRSILYTVKGIRPSSEKSNKIRRLKISVEIF